MVLAGTYANGIFTVTGETYSESGTYSSAQNIVTTNVSQWGTSTNQVDSARAGSYSLSFTAAGNGYGQLTYTDYDYVASDTAHAHASYSSTGGYMFGGLYETTTNDSFSVHTTGGGSSGSSTGSDASSTTYHSSYPGMDGTPYEYTFTNGYNNPISGSTYLSPEYMATYGWAWKAHDMNATGFAFHGVTSRHDSLTESLTANKTMMSGTAVDVNSFSSASHFADSGHVVDDEPGYATSGAELFHRDELFASVDDVTGGGSYVGGGAAADYHASEVGTFAANNAFTVTNSLSSGLDEDGVSYTLAYNFNRASAGGGTITNTHDYHDAGAGLALTGETVSMTGGSAATTHSWGVRNGQAFDDSDTSAETVNQSTTLPGNAGVIAVADSLQDAVPFRAGGAVTTGIGMMDNFAQAGIIKGAIKKGPQSIYNEYAAAIGAKAQTKVTRLVIKVAVLGALSPDENGENPSATGTISFPGKGATYAEGFQRDEELSRVERQFMETKNKINWDDVKVVSRDIEITYAVDQANINPRSGSYAARYKITTNYSGTHNGQQKTQSSVSLVGIVADADDKIKKMDLK